MVQIDAHTEIVPTLRAYCAKYAAWSRLSSMGLLFVQEIPYYGANEPEFRSEFFNVFNHQNLQFAKSGPQNSINTTFGTSEFGFLTAARDPRQIQFALKLSF
jgi:hypothetical protein